MKYNNNIYRSFEGGVAPINEDLEIIVDEKIGDYDHYMLYHADVLGDNVWVALTDFSSINQVKVLSDQGEEVHSFDVGDIPGDFTAWEMCYFDGNLINDEILNIYEFNLNL